MLSLYIQLELVLKAALDPCSLINSLAIYFDGVSCCKCLRRNPPGSRVIFIEVGQKSSTRII